MLSELSTLLWMLATFLFLIVVAKVIFVIAIDNGNDEEPRAGTQPKQDAAQTSSKPLIKD